MPEPEGLTIDSSDAVRRELETLANEFKSRAAEAEMPEDDVTKVVTSVLREGNADAYANCLPLVSRAVSAELDTDSLSKRGVGRLVP